MPATAEDNLPLDRRARFAAEIVDRQAVEFGREIFRRAGRTGTISLFEPLLTPIHSTNAWIDERVMALAIHDPTLKAQLFRFVDVLPALVSPDQINRHLREYLIGAGKRVPLPFRKLVWWIPMTGPFAAPFAHVTRFNVRRMARRFIAASEIAEAARTVCEMRRQNLAFTIDVLGEAVLSESEADVYARTYVELLRALADRLRTAGEEPLVDRDHAGPIPRVNVSVKLSSLYSQFDPIDACGSSRAVRDRLRPILRLARQLGAMVNFDMEQFAFKDLTIRIFKEICDEDEFKSWADVGIAIQAYLRCSGQDLNDLADWARRRGAPVWVRLVKGAYWDYETVIAAQNGWPVPVFTDKAETDANFESLTDFLMSHWKVLRPAVASHNVRSLAYAIASALDRSVPHGAFEFQTLYGMADEIKSALVAMGYRVRVYTPFGQLLPGMAYLVRRLLENTSNDSFLRAGYLEHVPKEQLLMNPLTQFRKPNVRRAATASTVHAYDRFDRRGNGRLDLPPFRNEPASDFSQPAPRAAMLKALEDIKQVLGRQYPLVIGGREIQTEGRIESINAWRRSQSVGYVSRATPEHANDAIGAARSAFDAWRDEAPYRRAELLTKVAAVLRRRRFELAAIEIYESAKPWRDADADVAEAIDFCEYYAREMIRLSEPQRRDVAGETNAMFYEPRGVCVILSPWNFPLAILTGMTAAAFVTGNTVVMKPAEQSPVIAAHLMEAFEEAGCPPGVVNFLPGTGDEVGATLVGHRDVAVVAFTGSRAVGLQINHESAAAVPGQDHVKRVIAEMGGKNAIIVDADADLDEAIHGVVASAFGYAGQKCSACSRVIVLDEVHDAFVSRLIEATRSLNVGPADDPATSVPPVIDAESRDRIWNMIETGKREATLALAVDVSSIAAEGYFVGPHIFTGVQPDSTLAQQEIFGPVLCVMRAKDLTHAVRIANGTLYALTGGLYSRSPDNIEIVKRDFRVGNLYINRKITGALVDRQPFGGFKLSGIGSKAGGPDYLQQFLIPRVVTENTLRRGFATGTDPVENAGRGHR